MKIVVYADESGTNDVTGQQPGSEVPTLCGYIDTPEYWVRFKRKWKQILNDYRAPYFHFREFASKHLCAKPSSPYHGWSEEKRDSFLYDLAYLCSDSAVPIGGCYHAKLHHQQCLEGNAFEHTIDAFFHDLGQTIEDHWPRYGGKVEFVFDKCDDERWNIPLQKMHAKYALNDARLNDELVFADDKDPKHLPLQAADLYAYAMRQHARRQLERRISGDQSLEPMRVLDYMLNRNLDPSRRQWLPIVWKKVVQLVREDQKRQKAAWAKAGESKKQYYPDQHFPYEKYGLIRHSRERP